LKLELHRNENDKYSNGENKKKPRLLGKLPLKIKPKRKKAKTPLNRVRKPTINQKNPSQ